MKRRSWFVSRGTRAGRDNCEGASEAGQKSIEHFTGLAQAEIDPTEAGTLIAILKKESHLELPTIIMRNNYAVLNDRSLANDPRFAIVKSSWRNSWLNMTTDRAKSSHRMGRPKRTVRREKVLVGRLQKGRRRTSRRHDDSNPYVHARFQPSR